MPAEDPIESAAIDAALRPPIAGPVVWLDEVGSTSDEVARRAALGVAEGLVVGAEHQTEGRGRRGRRWNDEAGTAIAMSILLRPTVPATDLGPLPVIAALAVVDGLRAVGVPDARVAWPNDILIGGRKVCGILCELSSGRDGVNRMIVGVGINVHRVPEVSDARWPPGALASTRPDIRRGATVAAVLGALGDRYRRFGESGPAGLVGDFAAVDALAGGDVRVLIGERAVEGVADGVAPDGRLRVVTPAGVKLLGVGEVARVVA